MQICTLKTFAFVVKCFVKFNWDRNEVHRKSSWIERLMQSVMMLLVMSSKLVALWKLSIIENVQKVFPLTSFWIKHSTSFERKFLMASEKKLKELTFLKKIYKVNESSELVSTGKAAQKLWLKIDDSYFNKSLNQVLESESLLEKNWESESFFSFFQTIPSPGFKWSRKKEAMKYPY